MAKIDFNQSNDDKPFVFELVLAERNYKGEPTGRMRKSFKTDDVHKLTEHYGRNSGHKHKKKKDKSANPPNP